MPRIKGHYQKEVIEAGCDEAGRGCLAGPVVAAAVILPYRVRLPQINDSKLLSVKVRKKLRKKIVNMAISYAVEFVYPKEIDYYNILQASIIGMKRAAARLNP